MEPSRIREILLINCTMYDELHQALVESSIDVGAEIMDNITKDQGLVEDEMGILKRLNRSLAWTGFFLGLRSNAESSNIPGELIPELIESMEALKAALVYINNHRKEQYKHSDLDNIDELVKILDIQLEYLIDVERLLESKDSSEFLYSINKEILLMNRNYLMIVMQEIIGEEITTKFRDQVNEALPVLRAYQSYAEAQIKDKTEH